jgi:hypothetical protein
VAVLRLGEQGLNPDLAFAHSLRIGLGRVVASDADRGDGWAWHGAAGYGCYTLVAQQLRQAAAGAGIDHVQLGVRSKLSALWATLMFLYVYADVLSLYRPGEIDDIRAGKMGPVDASQGTLLVASVVVIVPALMVVLSLLLPSRINRWTNIAAGVVFTLVNIANVIGESWVYYWVFGILGILITSLIVRYAWASPEIAP